MHARSLSILVRSAVFFVLIASTSLASPPASAQVVPSLPVLASATTSVNPPEVTIRGEGFTPGGDVIIVFHNLWGGSAALTRWTTASEHTMDMLGHDDPALGYREGGVVVESFSNFCGQQVMIRAYDQGTGTWSNIVDVSAGC